MKVLVCGNDRFTSRNFVFAALQRIEYERDDITLIQQFGDAGPAAQARNYAWESFHIDKQGQRIPLKTYHHDFDKGGPGAHHYVHEWIVTALQLFETAEPLRLQGNDDVLLRWNACIRFLSQHHDLAPAAVDIAEPIVSE